MSDKSKSFERWREEHLSSDGLQWPSETLVRLFKANYVPGLTSDLSDKKVLVVGFGNGNNLKFLGGLGLDLYGTEVHEDICRHVERELKAQGLDADLRVGVNTDLPFRDEAFDYLVSWNVIHYEDNEDDIRSAIREYHRVLAPGGRFFLSTTGPEHKILVNAEMLGGHRYRIGREDDFREGEVYFYFDREDYVEFYFSEYFDEILTGRTHDHLLTGTLDWFIATGVKGPER